MDEQRAARRLDHLLGLRLLQLDLQLESTGQRVGLLVLCVAVSCRVNPGSLASAAVPCAASSCANPAVRDRDAPEEQISGTMRPDSIRAKWEQQHPALT